MSRKKRNREITSIGVEIKKRLLDKHMNQIELAEKVGTSKNYITDIIHGKYPFIRSHTLKKVLHELGIDREVGDNDKLE